MKIGFLLGWPQISGGSYVIYEHASRLKEFGHEVVIITKEHVDSEQYSWHPTAGTLEWLPLGISEKRQFDIVIATWWESPFLLHQLMASHYVYFVQSIESRFWKEPDVTNHDTRENDLGKLFCESTYSYNIPIITEAAWIKDYLFQHYNHNAFLVRNGIRKDIYTLDGGAVSPHVESGIRVLIEGPVDVPYKNVPLTVELCKEANVAEIWLLTSSKIKNFPGVDRVFSCVPVHETPSIYRSCDVLVKLSYIEGMFGPPLEMFHCGGTSLVYDVTGHDEYIDHDQNSYVVEKGNRDQVVSYLKRLHNDPDELNRLKEGAKQTAAVWYDWDKSSKAFEHSLVSISKGRKTSQKYLKEHTEALFEQHQLRITAREMKVLAIREQNDSDHEQTIDNFVQFYWHSGEGWSQERCQWLHYRSGEWVTASFQLEVHATPIHLRIDPSVHMGVIELRSIKITDCNSEKILYLYDKSKNMSKIEAQGTFYSLPCKDGMMFLSYGNDPQLLVPYCEDIKSETDIQVTIVFRETGIRQFLERKNTHCLPSNKSLFARMLHRLI